MPRALIKSNRSSSGFKQDRDLQEKVDFVHWNISKRPVVSDPPKESESGTQQSAQVKHVISKDPNWQVLIIIDNTSCHEKAAVIAKVKGHIPNIEVAYLPKNSMSVTQPLDAGMIAVFKELYKQRLSVEKVKRTLSNPLLDIDEDLTPNTATPAPDTTTPAPTPAPTPAIARISNLDGWRFV
ncbi:hypothetical protein BG006_000954 [Podila minutissima]|uniref:DDE-1 domain-containing protein n=1 Tax=Podila minutissima TaxID=64525 RepID=A0A9P5SCY2_9FUNG|nr:hypothetical protein BG006_000954 [Podila minutissima]